MPTPEKYFPAEFPQESTRRTGNRDVVTATGDGFGRTTVRDVGAGVSFCAELGFGLGFGAALALPTPTIPTPVMSPTESITDSTFLGMVTPYGLIHL